MNKVLKGILITAAVFIGFVIIANIFMYVQVYRAMEWSVRDTIPSDRIEYFANISMYPDAVQYAERYGSRGWRDTEYRIETIRFESKEKLFEALPGCEEGVTAALTQDPKPDGKDLKETKVREYKIAVLPLKKEEDLSDKYVYDAYFRSFYIDVYDDGSVRLILDVSSI